MLRVSVDTAGKSDVAVSTEVRDQLSAQGVASPSATFTRQGNATDLDMKGNIDGKELHVKRVTVGDPGTQVQMQFGGPGSLDTERRPGETDDALKQRILDQLHAQGLEGNVDIVDGHLRLQVQKVVQH